MLFLHTNKFVAVMALAVALGFALPVQADEPSGLARLITTEKPAVNTQQIAPSDPLRLTPNKNELIRLDEDAASVIVNNPLHATVMLDSARLLIVAPRQPGTTSFTVLNHQGRVIMQRDVIVTGAQPKYVRVRRVCSGNDQACVPAAYYYCPDGCYEVTPVPGTTAPTMAPPPAGSPAMGLSPALSRMVDDMPVPPAPAENDNMNDGIDLPIDGMDIQGQ